MKKSILLLVLLSFCFACGGSGDSADGTNPLPSSATFAKCKSEGINWENFDPRNNTSTMKVSYYEGSGFTLFSFQLGEAGKSNGRRVFLSFGFSFKGKGKYKISPIPADDSVIYSYYGIDRLSVLEGASGSGEVEITEHVAKQYVTGKFYFDVEKNGKSSKVESGEFKVKVDF